MTNALSLKIEKVISTSVERVYDAWLNADMLKKFIKPGPDMVVPEAFTEPKVGGSFKIVMRAGDQDIPHTGEYKELDRPNKIVFTWNSAFSDNTLVTLLFESLSAESTKVTLIHEGFTDDESLQNHTGGWKSILEVLAAQY